MHGNPVQEYNVLYDSAECDGGCLADDCQTLREQIQEIMRKTGNAKAEAAK